MAIYHLSLKAIQRSKGRSSTASAAYRSRSRITDKRTGLTYDYTRKKGIEARAIFTPDGSKISRADLWNLAEESERRKDGITAREWEIALPWELDKNQRMELTKNFCFMLMERYGIAADVAIHAPTQEGDQRNFHAHVQTTTRRLVGGALGAKSDFELSGTDRRKKGLRSQKEELEEIRQEWERMVNASLEKAGRPERVNCKSLAHQGESRPPTVHLGVAATAMERQGVQTERGDLNRWPVLRRMYGELQEMKKNLRSLEADLAKMQGKGGEDEPTKERRGEAPDVIVRRNAGVGKKTASYPEEKGAGAGFADGGHANQAAAERRERPVQPDQIPAGRAEKPTESAGRAEAGYSGLTGETGRNPRFVAKDLRDAQRISGKGQAGGLSSRQDSSGEDRTAGRADRDDLGSRRADRRACWLERLKQLEEIFIRRLIEYRTIGDLLAMGRREEKEKQAQKEAEEAKKRPQGPK